VERLASHPPDRRVRARQLLGKPFGRPVIGQRLGVATAHQLEMPARVVEQQPGRGPGLGTKRGPCPGEPSVCLVEPGVGDHRAGQHRVGHAGDRLLAPAVPLCQLDRLSASLRGQRERPEVGDHRRVRQTTELEIRLLDPASRGDSIVQVPLGVFEPTGPDLRGAEADQRRCVTFLADPEILQGVAFDRREQPLGFHRDGGQIRALAREVEPLDPEHHLKAGASGLRHRRQTAQGNQQLSLCLVEGSPAQCDGRTQRDEFGIADRDLVGKSGHELMRGRRLTAEHEAKPAIGEDPCGELPVLGRLGVAYRLDVVPARVEPFGGGPM
jgi:hypothetical protein